MMGVDRRSGWRTTTSASAARHEARIDAREQAHADRLLDGDEQALDQQEDMYGFYFDY